MSSRDHTWSFILGCCQVVNSRRLREKLGVDGETLLATLKEKGGIQCKTRAQWVSYMTYMFSPKPVRI